MKEKILAKIIERAAPIWGVSPDELNQQTAFSDMNAKSTHYSQITTHLEDAFDIEVPFMQFRRCKTLGEAAEFVEELIEEQ
jgi:acyl carrier protein